MTGSIVFLNGNQFKSRKLSFSPLWGPVTTKCIKYLPVNMSVTEIASSADDWSFESWCRE